MKMILKKKKIRPLFCSSTRQITYHPLLLPIQLALKATLIYSPAAIRHHLIRDSGAPRFNVRRLRIRIVSQRVVCVHSVALGSLHGCRQLLACSDVFLHRREDDRLPPHTLVMDVTITHS